MGAYWMGFTLGGFSIMTLIAILKAGAPPWVFIAVFVAWAIVVVGIGEYKSRQAKVRESQHRPGRVIYKKYRGSQGA